MPISLPQDAPSPRICRVQKIHPSDEYGFNLHAEKSKGQYVGSVDAESPADIGGLRENDRIIGVNGDMVLGLPHKEVVQKIKANPLFCELFVITEHDFFWYQNHGIPLSYDLPNIVRPVSSLCPSSSSSSVHPQSSLSSRCTSFNSDIFISKARIQLKEKPIESPVASDPAIPRASTPPMTPRPLLCHLSKRSPTQEFGFNLHAERNKGHFIGSVDKGGIAYLAGLETGQRIVGVNGELIYPTSPHKEVVALIKHDPLDTSLLVASEEVDRWYTENGIPYSFDLAVTYKTYTPPRSQSRTATVSSQKTNGTAQPTEDAQTDVVYVPTELKEEQLNGHNTSETSEVQESEESTDSEVRELQNIENAAVGSPDDLLEKVFSSVPPPKEDSHKHVINNYNSVTPLAPISVRNSPSIDRTPLSSPEKDENVDIFKMSAKKAREILKHKKRDPRAQGTMTLEEKHQLIANL
uniref:PDZ domain-containing protein n=1 Tax=Bursaphelenchus xylophilus TaxID=6326 RepID=A0A1I7S3C0_BURXY